MFQGGDGFNYRPCLLFMTVFRLIIRLRITFDCATFDVKIFENSLDHVAVSTILSKHENYFVYIKGTYLEHIKFGKIVLFYLFTGHWVTNFPKLRHFP